MSTAVWSWSSCILRRTPRRIGQALQILGVHIGVYPEYFSIQVNMIQYEARISQYFEITNLISLSTNWYKLLKKAVLALKIPRRVTAVPVQVRP